MRVHVVFRHAVPPLKLDVEPDQLAAAIARHVDRTALPPTPDEPVVDFFEKWQGVVWWRGRVVTTFVVVSR